MKKFELSDWTELKHYVDVSFRNISSLDQIMGKYRCIQRYLYPTKQMSGDNLNWVGKYLIPTHVASLYKDGDTWSTIIHKWNPFSWPIIGMIKLSDSLTGSHTQISVDPNFAKNKWDVWTHRHALKYNQDIETILQQIRNQVISRFGYAEHQRCFGGK